MGAVGRDTMGREWQGGEDLGTESKPPESLEQLGIRMSNSPQNTLGASALSMGHKLFGNLSLSHWVWPTFCVTKILSCTWWWSLTLRGQFYSSGSVRQPLQDHSKV